MKMRTATGGMTPGFVGAIGRTQVEFALVDEQGLLRPETITTYTTTQESMISGAISRFCNEASLSAPCRLALAVAGVVRSDAIRITNTQWIVSRSGITAMLGHSPVLVNDFAAKAWALAGAHRISTKAIGAQNPISGAPGTRCLIGIDEALGIAAVNVDESGRPCVTASEGGASALPYGALPADVTIRLVAGRPNRLQSDSVISAAGLVSLYNVLCERTAQPPRLTDAYAIARTAAHLGGDRIAIEATRLFCDAIASFASNLVLIYGAWEGICFTGKLADILRTRLEEAVDLGRFAPGGPHARRLATVPLALVSFDHGELAGAAIALEAQRHGSR